MTPGAGPKVCRLEMEGELDGRFAALFDGLELSAANGTTVLSGHLADQAHLLSVIDRIHELGLVLVSVESQDLTDSTLKHH
jgi:hypothetical protein